MIFRAVSGYDPLSYDTKVGFDVSQLEILFPEEMNAYKRWEKVREAACWFFFSLYYSFHSDEGEK